MAADTENPYLPVELPEFGVSVGWAMCRNTMCRNFGIQYAGPAQGDGTWVSDGRYDINPRTGDFRCGYCGSSFALNSNRAISKLARYFLSLSLPFATCPRTECVNFGRNVFEHYSPDRRDRDRPYRLHQDDRMLCRAHAGERVTFALGEPLYLDRGSKREKPETRNKRRRAALKRLRRVIKGAMYYRSVSMIVEDFEVDGDTYYTQLLRAGRRLRDYQSWRNAGLLNPRFARGDAPRRVYTDTLVASVARFGKFTRRFTHLNIPVSVIDMPEHGTYYVLAAHPGFLPEDLCQSDLGLLAMETAGPVHTSPWACAEHPLTRLDPSSPTEKQMESLPDIGRGGWFARSPYLELAHFLTVRKMLSRFPKVYYYMDANRQQSAAALTAFADDIRAGRCEIALYQKRSKAEKQSGAEAAAERWPKEEEQEQWLKAKLDAAWGAREARWPPQRADVEGAGDDMSDEQFRAAQFAPLRLGSGEDRRPGWLDFPPRGPRYIGGRALWLTQRPDVTYEAVGRELLWSANILQVDRAHAHLRDDVRGVARATFRADPGRSFRAAYRVPLVIMAEIWLAMFWRNFGPRRPPRRALKPGEKPRPTPAAAIGLARSNEPRKPDLATLAWNFRLGPSHVARMSRWFRK